MGSHSRGAFSPEACVNFAHFWKRGRRESRVPIAPMGPVQKKHGAGPQVNRKHPGFPCAMVYDLLRALPGDRALLPPSPARTCSPKLSASIGAPGPHDFAVRDQLRSSSQAVTSTASHRAFVTCATPLSSGETGRGDSADLPDGLSGIFFSRGLDRFLLICPTGSVRHALVGRWVLSRCDPAGTDR